MKHVVIVGATDGIGKALARSYLAGGWRVGVVARDAGKLEAVLGELRAASPAGVVLGYVCDASDTECIGPALSELVFRLGHMDLFVYAAGVSPGGSSLEDRLGSINPTLDVNVRGAFHFFEWAADYFTDVGGGRIAAVGSVAGVRGRKGNPVYGASKAALHHYVEGLRNRLFGTGVKVSLIKPGWVRTRMLGPRLSASKMAIDVDRAVELIVRGLRQERDDFFVPGWWQWVALVLRMTPRPLYKRVAPP